MRRIRGVILRLARRRGLAIALGLALAVPGALVEWLGRDVPGWLNGLSLLAVATGIALVWTGLTGVRPDWIDD
jgi:hypothetical protein